MINWRDKSTAKIIMAILLILEFPKSQVSEKEFILHEKQQSCEQIKQFVQVLINDFLVVYFLEAPCELRWISNVKV